jgi:uncharacterized membrane protein YgdD (TMEM256/DUF423 family)
MLENKSKIILLIGLVTGALAVIFGAFGAHLFQEALMNAKITETFKTAVLYHFIHAIMITLAGIIYQQKPSGLVWISSILFFSGILLFSGSLYFYCLVKGVTPGLVTPAGGLCFILGWIILAWSILKKG